MHTPILIHTQTHMHTTTTTSNKEGGQPKAGPMAFSGRDTLSFSEVGLNLFPPTVRLSALLAQLPYHSLKCCPETAKTHSWAGELNASSAKALVAKPDGHEFNPRDPHGGQSEQALCKLSSDLRTHAVARAYTFPPNKNVKTQDHMPEACSLGLARVAFASDRQTYDTSQQLPPRLSDTSEPQQLEYHRGGSPISRGSRPCSRTSRPGPPAWPL